MGVADTIEREIAESQLPEREYPSFRCASLPGYNTSEVMIAFKKDLRLQATKGAVVTVIAAIEAS